MVAVDGNSIGSMAPGLVSQLITLFKEKVNLAAMSVNAPLTTRTLLMTIPSMS